MRAAELYIATGIRAHADLVEGSRKNAENVETKGIFPARENPSAVPTIFCSAIYISKKRSG